MPLIANRTSLADVLCGRLLLLLFLLPLPALAWNSAGHRLIACIAWDNLDQHTRTEVSQLLREHPDYGRWAKRAGDDVPERVAFIEASTWPDDIRKDSRFYNAGVDDPTSTLPGFPDMERRRNWHYVNLPLDESQGKEPISGLLDKQLEALAKTLGSPGTPKSERAYALPWIIHLIGDAHQPLHTSTRLDADGKWDKLGNGLTVVNPFNSRKGSSTLHAYWDDLPGPPWLRGERLDSACRALIASHPHPAHSTSAQWIKESWLIARQSAYPPGNDNVATISAEFDETAREIANRRVAEAGYRLADLLRETLGRQ